MVYVFLADGFEEVEALTPVDLLRRAGAEVRTVGVGSKNITGAHGITVACNMSEDEAAESIKEAPEALEMTVLPGGMPGTLNLGKSETVSHFLDAAAKRGAYIGAICAAPSVLGAKGLLRGRRAVCYPGFEDKLTGAKIENAGVVRDGNIICARAAGSAVEFALCLISALKGERAAEEVRHAIIAQ